MADRSVLPSGWGERVEGVHALGRISLLLDVLEASALDSREYAIAMVRLGERMLRERREQSLVAFEACFDRSAQVRSPEVASLWFMAGRLHEAFRLGMFTPDLPSAAELQRLVEVEVSANLWRGTSFEGRPSGILQAGRAGSECMRVSVVPVAGGLWTQANRRWMSVRHYRAAVELSQPAA